MEVAITGSTGFIGTALVERLREEGHGVRRIVRSQPKGDEVAWDQRAGTIDAKALVGVEAVIHLAGEGIGDKRWSEDRKRLLLTSRTTGTKLVAETVATLDPKPAVLLSGSAIGFYGDRGDEVLTEDSPPGQGFLPELVMAWEAAAQPALDAGIRTCFLRTGLVQSPEGGALAKTLPLFKFGLGGRLGSGDQWWPWISLDDEVGAIVHLLAQTDISGPVNLTSPSPVTNAEYTKALGQALHRPTLLPIPSFAPKLLLGAEMIESMVYSSARVMPTKLEASDYSFADADLDGALRRILGS